VDYNTYGNQWDIEPIQYDKPKTIKYDNQVNVSQHYGKYPAKGNLRPTNKNRGIAFKLAYFLSKSILTDEDRVKIKDSLKKDRLARSVVKKQKQNSLHENTRTTFSKNNLWSRWMSDGHATVRKKDIYQKPNFWNNEAVAF
jgi:hypothetical protein